MPALAQPIALIMSATATVTGETAQGFARGMTFQASGVTSSGSGSATVNINVSNDGQTWMVLGTITLTLGTTATGNGFAADAPWAYVRACITAISGTGAAVTVTMGA